MISISPSVVGDQALQSRGEEKHALSGRSRFHEFQAAEVVGLSIPEEVEEGPVKGHLHHDHRRLVAEAGEIPDGVSLLRIDGEGAQEIEELRLRSAGVGRSAILGDFISTPPYPEGSIPAVISASDRC